MQTFYACVARSAKRKPVSAHRPSICQAIVQLFLMTQNSMASYLMRRHLPVHASAVELLGVDYAHLPTADRGDLYVSWDGLHRLDQLLLENWRLAERRSALFVRHFQKKQIRQLLDVIAIRQPVIPQDVASSSRAFGQFDANSLYRN